MDIQFEFKNVDPSEHLKEYARTRFEKLTKYIKREDSAVLTVMMEVDRYRQIVEVKLGVDDLQLTAQGESEDMYVTIDQVLDKLRAQLKRNKDKEKDRRKGKLDRQHNPGASAAPVTGPLGGIGAEPVIERESLEEMKPMSPEEAVIQLEETERKFLVFVNAENERVNVIYSKNTGDYGLIDPRM
ncbi:MAG: ribosome-associated translation inhibitor RaiA [Desulfohalobiaceae bacterium]|nr:ribosome-associated translation inhibitor RaiA [Desulfohalobiaceae bacterium]